MMKGFKRLLRIYSRLAAIHWGIMLQYRAEVTIWAFWSVTSPIVYLAVWRAIAQARGPIGGYEADAFVGYFLLQSIVYHFTSAWQVYDFGHEIRSGEFSSKLLRPMDPVHQWVTQNAAFKLVNFIWLAPAWVGLFLYFRPAIAFSWESVVGFIAALAAAALLRFLWSQAWSMLCFWTVRAHAGHDLIDALVHVLGGGVAPIAVLPPLLADLAYALPFWYSIGFPIEVGLGHVSGPAIWRGVFTSLLWSVFLLAVYRALWRQGLKRHSAVGA